MKAAGRQPSDGKRKGGVKVHMAIHAVEDVPNLVKITPSAANDTTLLKSHRCVSGSSIVFDKG
jgi:hypothetical protein